MYCRTYANHTIMLSYIAKIPYFSPTVYISSVLGFTLKRVSFDRGECNPVLRLGMDIRSKSECTYPNSVEHYTCTSMYTIHDASNVCTAHSVCTSHCIYTLATAAWPRTAVHTHARDLGIPWQPLIKHLLESTN